MTTYSCRKISPSGKKIYHMIMVNSRKNYFFCSFCIFLVSPELLLLLLANTTNATMYVNVRSGKIDSLISISFLYELVLMMLTRTGCQMITEIRGLKIQRKPRYFPHIFKERIYTWFKYRSLKGGVTITGRINSWLFLLPSCYCRESLYSKIVFFLWSIIRNFNNDIDNT